MFVSEKPWGANVAPKVSPNACLIKANVTPKTSRWKMDRVGYARAGFKLGMSSSSC